MPNWTDNVLVVKGDRDEVRKFYDFNHTIDKDSGNLDFTLNNLIPVPEELLNVDINEASSYTDEDKARIVKYGFANWHEFCTNLWGTKWDVDGPISKFNEDGTELTITFSTAWDCIAPWIREATRRYPKLRFEYKSCDPAANWHYELCTENGGVVRAVEGTFEDNMKQWEDEGWCDYFESDEDLEDDN